MNRKKLTGILAVCCSIAVLQSPLTAFALEIPEGREPYEEGSDEEVTNYGTILNGAYSAPVINNGTIKGGTFHSEVTNYGTLRGGSYRDSVTNYGTIDDINIESSGSLTNYGTIVGAYGGGGIANYGTIKDGHFVNGVLVGASSDYVGTISGGHFLQGAQVTVENGGTISGGSFDYSTRVIVGNGGTISGGNFECAMSVWVQSGGKISGGTYGNSSTYVSDGGIITGGSFEEGLIVENAASIQGPISGNIYSSSDTGTPVTCWHLSVVNGYGTGEGDYPAGANPTISAGTRSGYTFTGWSIEGEGGGNFADVNAASTTFTMPEGDVTIRANWQEIASGDSGSTDYSDQTAGRSSSTGEDLDEASSDRENSESDKSTDPSTSVTSGAQKPVTDPMMVLVEAATEKLQKAKAGSTLVLDNKRWNSYSLYFMKELQKRRDLTIVIKYIYKNENYTVTIPAGQEIKLDEEILWYGPLKLASMFETEVTK